MTVYEMIQELSRYDADMEVEANVYAKGYEMYVEVQEDAQDGEEVTAKADIDEDITDISVDEYRKWNGGKVVRINLVFE